MADPIKVAKDKWERTVLKDWVKEHPESRKEFLTRSGIPLERVYAPSGPDGSYLERQVYGSFRDTARF